MTDALPLTADLWRSLAAILALLIAAALFSGAETALTAASRGKLKAMADRGQSRAKMALKLAEDGERMIGALLLAKNIVTLLAAALAAEVLIPPYGALGALVGTGVVVALLLIFGEVLPKTLSILAPETVAIAAAPLVRAVIFVLAPIVTLVRVLVRAVLRLFGLRPNPEDKILALRQEIMGAITLGHSTGAVEKEDRDRLLGALDLSSRTVDEIMRHRRQIEMIDADDTPDEIIAQVLGSAHSRLPIFKDDEENILGILHAKDLLREVDRLRRNTAGADIATTIQELDVVKVAMKPYFIPDTTSLDDQMRAFLARNAHLALVVDEYGSLQGLITLEDILEEIVGEINDEFDAKARDAGLKQTEGGDYIVDGAMTIRDINRAMDWNLPDDEANTIAGLVIHEAQMIPTEGQAFIFHGFRFQVVQRRENRVVKLLMRAV